MIIHSDIYLITVVAVDAAFTMNNTEMNEEALI